MWLTGRLAPDFQTIADFRRDNGEAIRRVFREFIELSRQIGPFGDAVVAIDGSKFKAVNNRDKNFTPHKLKARMQQLEESTARYLNDLDCADREPTSMPAVRVTHLKEKIATVKEQVRKLRSIEKQLQETLDQQVSLTDPDARSMATSGRRLSPATASNPRRDSRRFGVCGKTFSHSLGRKQSLFPPISC